MARPPHQPTDETRAEVTRRIRNGVSQERVAKALGVAHSTLVKHYREELDASAGVWEAEFEECIKTRALKADCPPAVQVFVAKSQMGWRELTPKDPDRKTLDDATDEELAALIGARAREQRQGGGGSDGGAPAQASAA